MFYANNEQVKGIFLNGRNFNYLSYGFGKIIPEDRNAEQLNLNLARKYLNQYRIEFGTVKNGYDNALVSPRFDMPDSNGVFHTPFTYYYNGNIVPTKEVNILITNGNYALRNALVYNDININGAINHFATDTDFQGHNVNVFPEKDNSQVYQALLNYEMLNNCNNFDLNIETRFSKTSYPTLYNCNNFSGNFRYVGNQDYNYPGFRGFLYDCKDGVFNIDCTNMHGGGNDANVRNYFNFSCIQRCENMNVDITGSPWQVWPHDHSFSSNCNINTYNVISGFSYMNYCNFNVVLPKDSKPEMNKGFEFLNNAENCKYNLNALDSNLYSYRPTAFFNNLNNCNLNLLVNNTVRFNEGFGCYLYNCNIVFDNIKAGLLTRNGWYNLYNCNITGNVESKSSAQGFLERCDNLNVNLNFAGSERVKPLSACNNVNGNITLGRDTIIERCNRIRLFNVNNGNITFNHIEYGNFSVYNAITQFRNVNNTNVRIKSKAYISALDNCHNIFLYDFNVAGEALLENVYDSNLVFNRSVTRKFMTKRVNNCNITGFPYEFSYTSNCRFDVGLDEAIYANSSYITWNNVWPHGYNVSGSYGYLAGLESVDGLISNCSLASDEMILGGSKTFVNSNNMQTSLDTFYNGTVTANLPIYNMEIKFNVDCNILNLGVFQAGPPHGFQNATISANTIYAKGDRPSAYVRVNCDTRIYCENYCNVSFRPYVQNKSSVLQPVILINNYDHYNTGSQQFFGGITRIGSLSTRTGSRSLSLYSGACVFINNVVLANVIVDNSLLFVGSNYGWTGAVNVTNGGRIVTLSDWDSSALSLVTRSSFAWNIWDSGPWGPQSLLNYCLNV